MAAVWSGKASSLFRVEMSPKAARAAIGAYAASASLQAAAAIESVGNRPVTFHALSLDAEGKPLPIIHSDEGFVLLFGNPDATQLDQYLGAILRPFPAGLLTPAGMVVANPVFASPALWAKFGPGAYHGAVIWSWQQALLAAGLERQLGRTDLPVGTRARLLGGRAALWRVISTTRSLRNSELWTWRAKRGQLRPSAFGANSHDADESNAAQLWSTVYLAVRPGRSAR
ncbi:hypothetical protein [Novosphingobium sp.]|uniref:hypothetical protein n=1 Tax=Novosphingobium sp. TaxID=1874826 RepID=UPI003BABB326